MASNALIVTSGLGSGANFATFLYITSIYDTDKCLYFILALDAALTSIASFLGFVIFLTLKIAPIINQTIGICILVQLFDLTTFVLCPLFSFMIAFIRRQNLNSSNPNGWKPDHNLIKSVKVITLTVFVFITAWVVFNAGLDLNLLAVYNFCHYADKAQDDHYIITNFCIGLPVTGLTICTAFCDIKTLQFIRTRHEKHVDKVPLNASIISTILSIPYLLYPLVMSNILTPKFSPEDKFFMILIPSTLINIFRNPIIATCAFRLNAANVAKESKAKERERKRQAAIKRSVEDRIVNID